MSSHELPKTYDFAEVEPRWQNTWRDEDNYFDRTLTETPVCHRYAAPRTRPATFHIGNALNWCYIDFIARYKRMKGIT